MTDSIGVRLSDADFYPVWKTTDKKTRRAVISPPAEPSQKGFTLSFYRSLDDSGSELAEIATFTFVEPVRRWEVLVSRDEQNKLYLYVKSDKGEEHEGEFDFADLPPVATWHRDVLDISAWDDNVFADYENLLPEFFADTSEEPAASLNAAVDEALLLPVTADPDWDDNFLDDLLEGGTDLDALKPQIVEIEEVPSAQEETIEPVRQEFMDEWKPEEELLLEGSSVDKFALPYNLDLGDKELSRSIQEGLASLDEEAGGEDEMDAVEVPLVLEALEGEPSTTLEEPTALNLPLDENSFQDFLANLGEASLFNELPEDEIEGNLEEALPWQLDEEPVDSGEKISDDLEGVLLDLDLEIALDGGASEEETISEDSFKNEILEELNFQSEEPKSEQADTESLDVSVWEYPMVREPMEASSDEEMNELPWQLEEPAEVFSVLREADLRAEEEFSFIPQEELAEGEETLPKDFDLDAGFDLKALLEEGLTLDNLPKEENTELTIDLDVPQIVSEEIECELESEGVPLTGVAPEEEEQTPADFSFLDEEPAEMPWLWESTDAAPSEEAPEGEEWRPGSMTEDLDEEDQEFLESLSKEDLDLLPQDHLEEDIQLAMRETVRGFAEPSDQATENTGEEEASSAFHSFILAVAMGSVALFTFFIGTLMFYQGMTGLQRPPLRSEAMDLRQHTTWEETSDTWQNADVQKEFKRMKDSLSRAEQSFKR